MAALNGDAGIGKFLIENSADINAQLKTGRTASDIASEKHHAAFIEMLRNTKR